MPNHTTMLKRPVAVLFALGLLALPGSAPAAKTQFRATLTNKWSPSSQKVAKGTKVVFTNPTEQPHDFKPLKGPWPDSKKDVWLYQGDSVSFKLGKKGKYTFRCIVHSDLADGKCDGMCGSVTVR